MRALRGLALLFPARERTAAAPARENRGAGQRWTDRNTETETERQTDYGCSTRCRSPSGLWTRSPGGWAFNGMHCLGHRSASHPPPSSTPQPFWRCGSVAHSMGQACCQTTRVLHKGGSQGVRTPQDRVGGSRATDAGGRSSRCRRGKLKRLKNTWPHTHQKTWPTERF